MIIFSTGTIEAVLTGFIPAIVTAYLAHLAIYAAIDKTKKGTRAVIDAAREAQRKREESAK